MKDLSPIAAPKSSKFWSTRLEPSSVRSNRSGKVEDPRLQRPNCHQLALGQVQVEPKSSAPLLHKPQRRSYRSGITRKHPVIKAMHGDGCEAQGQEAA